MFIIESLTKIQRKYLKEKINIMMTFIDGGFVDIKTKNIKGYNEPKDLIVSFYVPRLEEKVKAIRAYKELIIQSRKDFLNEVL